MTQGGQLGDRSATSCMGGGLLAPVILIVFAFGFCWVLFLTFPVIIIVGVYPWESLQSLDKGLRSHAHLHRKGGYDQGLI